MLSNKILVTSLITGVLIGLVGCSDSSSTLKVVDEVNTTIDDTNISTKKVSGRIVDPYIEGAILCEDLNKDENCTDNEQKSTASSKDGEFTFSNELTVGSHIITDVQGKHNGVDYNLLLSGIVSDDGTIDIISPLTTLHKKGLNEDQIVKILTDAGLEGLTITDILSDPMKGLSGKTSITDNELKYLQASLATYGLLKIIKGSETLSALGSKKLVNSSEINNIATTMVTAIKNSLNKNTFTTIQAQIDIAKSQIPTQYASYVNIPDVKIDVVIRTAVTIMDRVVESAYNKCKETDGDITLALQEASNTMSKTQADISKISEYYYGLENKNDLSTLMEYSPNSLSDDIQYGMTNDTGVLKLDDTNSFVTVDQQKISVNALEFYIHLNGGVLGDDFINIDVVSSYVQSITMNDSNQSYDVSDSKIDIPLDSINDGKNKWTIRLKDGREYYFYIYKGLFDAQAENLTYSGNTHYNFTSIKADGKVANDMFIQVDNNNNITTTSDDYKILLLPNDNGEVFVQNLKSSAGHSILSSNYENWRVASVNVDITGQDTNMSYNIDLDSLSANTAISGLFLKIDENSDGVAVPFTIEDTQRSDIWLHAHYAHPTATYSATCSGSLCTKDITDEVIFIATEDMHLGHQINSTYDFNTGKYQINNLSGDHNYSMLAFWLNENLDANYPTGYISSGVNSDNHNIVFQTISKDVNGTLLGEESFVKVARVVTFSGQPVIHYSDTVLKDSNNNFTLNYQNDSEGTISYILWGDESTDMKLSESANCEGITNCKTIIIGGDEDSSTDIEL